MKKIVCLLSAILCVSLAACAGQKKPEEAGGFQAPMEGVHWGMSWMEAKENLALPEDSVLSDNEKVLSVLCEDVEIFGRNADAELIFDVQYEIGLVGMRISFTELTEDSRRALIEELNDVCGEYSAVDDEGKPCRWESERIEDMPEKLQERFRHVKVKASEGFSQETVWNNLKEQALVKVSLGDDMLTYYAENMAAALKLSADAAYEAFEERLGVKTK